MVGEVLQKINDERQITFSPICEEANQVYKEDASDWKKQIIKGKYDWRSRLEKYDWRKG